MGLAFGECNKLGGSGDMNGWDVSSVKNMNNMFEDATTFNQDISNWDVSNVTNMGDMFYGAPSFNQPIGNWNVSSVTEMAEMFFGASSFNQPIGNWDVSNVQYMYDMFHNALAFNQDISNWNVSNVIDMTYMFMGDTAFSPDNYGHLLIGWSQLNLQQNVPFSAGSTPYPVRAAIAKQDIIDIYSWEITDGGPANPITPTLNQISSPSITGNVNLEWSSSLTDLNYSVYRSNSNIATLTGTTLVASNLTENSYQDTNLVKGTYYYVILASNGTVNSSISNCESVSVIFKPSEPTNLNVTAETNSILLTWEASTDNGGSTNLYYDIYRSDSANGTFALIGNSTTTSYNDTKVTAGQTYYYKISAVNEAGQSNFSNVATSAISKNINGIGIGELLSVSFVGVLVVAIIMKKRKSLK